MSEANLDFFWFIFRRNLWDDYFYKGEARFGAEDYLHALAALHRGNRSYVRFKSDADGKTHKALCYTFQNELRPLYLDGRTELQRFNAFIPGEWVLKQTVLPLPVNEYVQAGKEEWWEDLSIYNKKL
jgi:L-ascorbate metabolism protein UlaG (beta-lactamase superfamily)